MKGVIIVVLAVLAVCASMALPELFTSRQRVKQRQTSERLRAWALELEAYADQCGGYPERTPGPVARIHSLLPNPKLVATDAWDHEILYHGTREHYFLHSLGRDGKNDFRPPGHPTTSFDDDLVYADGTFLQYPEGL